MITADILPYVYKISTVGGRDKGFAFIERRTIAFIYIVRI